LYRNPKLKISNAFLANNIYNITADDDLKYNDGANQNVAITPGLYDATTLETHLNAI